QRAKEPKSQRAKEPKSQRAKEPKSQRAKEPKSQRAKELSRNSHPRQDCFVSVKQLLYPQTPTRQHYPTKKMKQNHNLIKKSLKTAIFHLNHSSRKIKTGP
ncbi:hypothetical protein, partial [Acetobacter lambici]|uniref:hypothetical protein n=1 Tax=Acetobacter lambici TaxID=1332824 RepID=UPI0020A561CE